MNQLVWLLLILVGAQSRAEVISTAVGRVRDHVLTSREVQINQAIELALTGKSAKAMKWVTDPDSQAFAKQVTTVLLEWVVHLEAQNMTVAQVSDGDMTKAESQVTATLGKLKQWRALQASTREIRQALKSKLEAKKFIRFRADSSVVPVSDIEAERYFEQNRLKFGQLPYANFRTGIKTLLARQQVEKRLKDWFEVLQAKYQVRNFLSEL